MSPTERSAGLLLFRPARSAEAPAASSRPGPQDPTEPAIEVMLVHMGGPYWSRREEHAWSIPKGRCEPGEEPLEAARREFLEELGQAPPEGPPIELGQIRQNTGKLVRAWALEGDIDTSLVTSNTFELEWPPRSGRIQRFPEVDRAGWFTTDQARPLLVSRQVEFIDRLLLHLAGHPLPL